ncbi:MAG TPA: hypothetical protein VIJ22_17865, partial [Polyangiaceae bacterium]
ACGGRESDGGAPPAVDAGASSHADAGAVPPDGGTIAHDAGSASDGGISHGLDSGSTFPESGAGDTGTVGVDAGDGCGAGSHDCGGTCLDDTSPASCGTSCTPCAAPANSVSACTVGGACSYTCETGYSVCGTGCCTCGDTQTDPNNCGYCGHSCGGESCAGGVCGSVVVATAQANAYAIAADDVNVYWTTNGTSGAILQAPVGGGGAKVIVSGSGDAPAGIAIDANNVYWANEVEGGGIESIPIGGGTPKVIASNLSVPVALTVVGSTIYFTLDSFQSMTGGAVLSVDVSGGVPVTLATNQTLSQTSSIAVGGGTVFWTGYSDLLSSPVASPSPTSFAPQVYPYAVAADAKNVYWTSGLSSGAVMQEPLGGGPPITLASAQYYPNAIAVDASNVYWTSGQGGAGTVMKVPIGGGAAVALATGQAYPAGIALNSTTVFWVNFGDGTIRSVPK